MSGFLSAFTQTLSSVSRNLQNVRLEDVIRSLVPKPEMNPVTNHPNFDMDSDKDSESSKVEAAADKERVEREKNEEYLLSIHSSKRRSRHRTHIRGKDDVIIINEGIATSSSLDPTSKAGKLFLEIDNKNNLAQESISFSGGGYNCMYHMGVVRYIFENPDLFRGTKYLGASGGAGIVAVVLCFESDPDKFKILNSMIEDVIGMRSANLNLSEQVKVYTANLVKHVTLDRFNRYIKDSDRCHISVTDVSGIIPRNAIKTKFESYKQFIDTLKASACIPIVLDDQIRKIDSKRYLDGGLSNNLPTLNEKTIRISCLNYPLLSADLYPKIICDIKYCFTPPDRNYVMNMHDLGYNDIEDFMKDQKQKLLLVYREKELTECITDLLNTSEFTSDEDVDD